MPNENADEMVLRLLEALEESNPDDDTAIDKVVSYLYKPDSRISDYLKELKEYRESKTITPEQYTKAGILLEQIVALAFCGLQGISSIKSFRSAGPQYDLLVGGDGIKWSFLCNKLYMQKNQGDIVVEAKCTKEKVSDQQFARLCSLMEINLFQTTGLGIFFTLNGASGFPKREDKTRQQHLTDARMRQALFHARTGKAIVVLDAEDILELDKPGLFVRKLISKIRDLEHLSGLASQVPCDTPELDLPNHLKHLLDKLHGN